MVVSSDRPRLKAVHKLLRVMTISKRSGASNGGLAVSLSAVVRFEVNTILLEHVLFRDTGWFRRFRLNGLNVYR